MIVGQLPAASLSGPLRLPTQAKINDSKSNEARKAFIACLIF
jgi:hypothetical protein